ncbi:MAG: hypothetical protein VX768_12150, partial [Planctomycetota bacterium]|nr:hypothetical protein [Planctomycetota bacterium]
MNLKSFVKVKIGTASIHQSNSGAKASTFDLTPEFCQAGSFSVGFFDRCCQITNIQRYGSMVKNSNGMEEASQASAKNNSQKT